MGAGGRPWVKQIEALGIGLALDVAIAGGAELAYRFYERRSFAMPAAQFVSDPVLIYRLNPAYPGQPRSFRGKAPGSEPGASLRVLCLGESSTYGHAVGDREAWPAVTETELRRRGIAAEVVNAGVPGYGSRQNLLRYERELAPLDLDYVVLYIGWNRTGALVDSREWVPLGISRSGDSLVRRTGTWLGGHSLLFRHGFTGFVARRERVDPLAHKDEGFRMDPYHAVYREDLGALVRSIKAHHQRPVLIVYPALYREGQTADEVRAFAPRLWEGRPFDERMLEELARKHEAIRAVAREADAALVDVQAALDGYRGAGRTALFMDEMHPTVEGNRVIGTVIADALTALVRGHRSRGLPRRVETSSTVGRVFPFTVPPAAGAPPPRARSDRGSGANPGPTGSPSS
jgi:lysophospholipase L1-like esterase